MPLPLKTISLMLCLSAGSLLKAQDNRIWGTYYDGSSAEGYDGSRVATDMNGNVYLAGWTSSNGIASNGYQDSLGGTHDAFLVNSIRRETGSGNVLRRLRFGIRLWCNDRFCRQCLPERKNQRTVFRGNQ
jgi:hypothetical protein